MSIALSEFWTRLVENGIADANDCKRIASAFSDANGGTPPSESVSLAKYLVKSGGLTEFQARAILGSRGLRVGSYVIRSDQSPPPLSRWVAAQAIGNGEVGYLFRAQPAQLAGGRQQWVEAHASISAPSLQPIQVEALGTETVVFSPMPEGQSLHLYLYGGCSFAPGSVRSQTATQHG